MDNDLDRELRRADRWVLLFFRGYLLLRKLLKKPLIPFALGVFLGCIIAFPTIVGWVVLGGALAYSAFFAVSSNLCK